MKKTSKFILPLYNNILILCRTVKQLVHLLQYIINYILLLKTSKIDVFRVRGVEDLYL